LKAGDLFDSIKLNIMTIDRKSVALSLAVIPLIIIAQFFLQLALNAVIALIYSLRGDPQWAWVVFQNVFSPAGATYIATSFLMQTRIFPRNATYKFMLVLYIAILLSITLALTIPFSSALLVKMGSDAYWNHIALEALQNMMTIVGFFFALGRDRGHIHD
jgi:hypothetical protein